MNIRITLSLVLAGMAAGVANAPAAAQAVEPAPQGPALGDAPRAVPQAAPQDVPLTLRDAVEAALGGNRALAAAEARAEAAELGAGAKEGFVFPTIQATAGAVRTNDPVGVFGTKLRQRRFEQADFDIGALNDPDAVNDWTAGVGAQWDIALWDRWLERDAGQAESRAARAVLVEAAEASAVATTERVRRRVDEGMGTQADLLQAEAAVSGIRAQVQHARARVLDVREALGSWLAWPADRLPVPSQGADVLNASGEPGAITDAELMGRADLVAGRAGVEAAEARARAVTAKRLPGLQAFGQVSTHAPGIGDSRENNWTVGVQLSVPLFTGFSMTRGAEAARAQARALRLEQTQREQEAETEVRSARRGVHAARAALGSATAAADAAHEAVRLLRRRYEEGMATVADLLQAEARAAQLSTGVVEAEANLSMALAALDFVLGNGAGSTREEG
jgi:outer membrane protein TolC